ncbi:wsc domain containing protein [Colletotrichum musicola]|uniref:Wsc domain containing protein n=1 Tax=Colletotrichum musicola TaxID=2175873 RepID=A0A8H6IYV0_9PEZI|nr:wsc domain containing protein [Colletotrichum musicola]
MRLTNVLVIAGQLLLLASVAAQLFPDPRPPYSYLGCYDGTSAGLTSNTVTDNSAAGGGDPVKCQADCNILASPYLYMRGNDCICQNPDQDQAPREPPLSDDVCNRPCSKNASAPCGGEFEYTLYGGRDPNTPPPSATLTPDPRPPYTYFGCYPQNAFTGQVEYKPDIGGNPVACQAACDAQGSSFAGMFNRNNCFCQIFGSAVAPVDPPADDSFCNAPCFRNASAPCGDTTGQYITLYGGREPTPPPEPTTNLVPKPQPPYRYIGCYGDGLNIVEDFTRVDGAQGNPPACQTACANLGSTYVLMYFIDCLCNNPGGSTVFPFRRPVIDGYCNEACFDDGTAACGGMNGQRVYYTVYSNRTEDPIVSATITETETATPAPTTVLSPDPRPPYSYLGCWDSLDLKLFRYEIAPQTGSPVLCQSYCNDRRAVYVASLAEECYCQPDASGDNGPVGSPVADSACNIPCNENVTAACGGIGFIYNENGELVRQVYYITLYGLRNETATSTSSSTLLLSTSSTSSSATGSGTVSGSSTSTGPAAGTSTSGTASTTPESGSQTSSSTVTPIAGTSSTASASSAPGVGGTTSSTSTFSVFLETLLPPPSTTGSTGTSNSPPASSLSSSSATSGAGSGSSGISSLGSPIGSIPDSSTSSATASASQSDSATASTSGTGTGTGTAVTTGTSTEGPLVSISTFFLVGTPVIFSIFPAGQAPVQTGT